MKIEIRADGKSMKISGYVNAVCRDSRPIVTPRGKVVEQIEEGVFQRAIDKADNIYLRLNHYQDKNYAETKEGTLTLKEDSIGLRAEAVITDNELIEKAKQKKLVGWSFGGYFIKDRLEERANNIPRRYVEEMELCEVSLIDQRKNPCYTGTSIEQRANEEIIVEQRAMKDEPEVECGKNDYKKYEEIISKIKANEGRQS